MLDDLETLCTQTIEGISHASSVAELEEIRVRVLGRKGSLTEMLRGVSALPVEQRPAFGQAANHVKQQITEALATRSETLQTVSETSERHTVDFSLPGRRPRRGHMHPVSQLLDEITGIFRELGFQVATGPDIESEYYNFDSLNFLPEHPSRDVHDTFFIEPGVVLRTHTSPVQMRVMEKTNPPVAVVVPGRVYRSDSDASHSPMFIQIEGLLVDKGVSFADLRGTLLYFVHRFFGPDTKIRFRPHYFPFTEPSAEVDVSCTICGGTGCRVCKHSGWLEILGCGMVHPNVFTHAGYDPVDTAGYAFGMGIDRIAMLRHQIDSIHHLYENDMRFLEQF